MVVKKQIAKIISRIFDPLFELPIILWLLNQKQPGFLKKKETFILLLFFTYFLPLLFFLFSWKLKFISDWDISERKERYSLFIFSSLSIISCLLIFYFLGEVNLLYFYLKVLLPVLFFFLITFFWKISGHLLLNSILLHLLYLNFHTSIFLILAVFILFLVGWSRVNLKKHNWLQVFAGAFLPWLTRF